MPALRWGMIEDGGTFESLMHALLFAEDAGTILFGRPGKDAGQDARSADGSVIYQAKYRQSLTMDGAIDLALTELETIKKYRQSQHVNYEHWQRARRWVLVANISINPNDDAKWQARVVPVFKLEGLVAEYWHIEILEAKLTTHAHVRDVFFGGENRVLVGLKEARDLLSATCVSSAALDEPMVGREAEMRRVNAFADSGHTRVLPVVGPGGIGKSRLLYESLVSLGQNGWRVLWALPGTMAKSSQWFRLLNGAQPTCVAIDDPDDPGLLRAVIEQLAPVERRKWKVIVAFRTEKAEALRPFRAHHMFEAPMQLGPLDEPSSKHLLNSCLGSPGDESWLHTVHSHARGVPGWLCLIAELARRGSLATLPTDADSIAGAYVNSCLQSLPEPHRGQGLVLLRWLSLWGVLRLDADAADQAELGFLDSQGIPSGEVRDLLRMLVSTGLVRSWGVRKRLHAVEPLPVREQILSSWLLSECKGVYEVSPEGAWLVEHLIKSDVPAVDSILATLSHLTRSRLSEPAIEAFMTPVFNQMARIAREGTLLDQYRVVDLVEKAGAADPESALDVLATIRRNPKKTMDVNVRPWGPHSFTHSALIAELPWVLFQIADDVSDQATARRFLEEFRELVALEDAGVLSGGLGKGARQLLKRLLSESKNSASYSQPAHDLVATELANPTTWPFVGLVLDRLLDPQRESMGWVSNWTITISKRRFQPGSHEWSLAVRLREMAFGVLRTAGDAGIRAQLWRILAKSHQEFHRSVMHGSVKGAASVEYRALLVNDLESCADILRPSGVPISIEEATHAREMWSWYLDYGRAEDPIALAQECERLYNGLSPWRLHEFFRFATNEKLAPETARIVGALRSATGPETFIEFFDEATRYLEAARSGKGDMADSWRISELADGCADLLSLDTTPPSNALTSFVITVLEQGSEAALAWWFAVHVCRRHLLGVKTLGDESAVGGKLARLLQLTPAEGRLLYGLYSNVHPSSTGLLTGAELEILLSHEREFTIRECFILLGGFAPPFWEEVQPRLRSRLDDLGDQTAERSKCMACFIQAVYLAVLRYDWPPARSQVAWIVEMITEFRLDGTLLDMHDLSSLRDQANYRLGVSQLVTLIASRIQCEEDPSLPPGFEVMPHDFDVSAWCAFDEGSPAEVAAFRECCLLALKEGFTAMYWMPKFVAQLDPSGRLVASFVEKCMTDSLDLEEIPLARLAQLASAYPDESEAWAAIARPICGRAQNVRREERERVFFGLAGKETEVLHGAPGEVADYFVQRRDNARRLLEAEAHTSALVPYRKWALKCAEADLQREQGRAEEVIDD